MKKLDSHQFWIDIIPLMERSRLVTVFELGRLWADLNLTFAELDAFPNQSGSEPVAT